MKQLVTTLLILAALLAKQSFAAPVSVASFVFDDSAFAGTLVSTSGSVSSSNSSATAITDIDATTFVYSTVGGSINLGFSNATIYNNDGADLALFFLGNESTVTVSIPGNATAAQSYSSNYLYAGNGDQYAVDIDGSYYGLSAALIDVSDFGMDINDVITNININLGVNNYLAIAAGFNIEPQATVVPLPAPLVLLLSGLGLLGTIGRKKHK